MSDDRLIDPDDLAAAIGRQRQTIRTRLREGKLPPLDLSLGRACYWKLESLRAFNPALAILVEQYLAARSPTA